MKLIYVSQRGVMMGSNPVLAQFREHMSGIVDAQYHLGGEASRWLWFMSLDPYFENENYWGSTYLRDRASLRHVAHARRVLRRLVSLSEAVRLCDRCREREPRSERESLCSVCTTEVLSRKIRNLK